jgi:hypothetical protein
MSHTTAYNKLPKKWDGPRKRIGRGRLLKGKNQRLVTSDSSASDQSPMKRVTFDLTGFSDNEEELGFEIRAPSPVEEEDLTVFESDDEEN